MIRICSTCGKKGEVRFDEKGKIKGNWWYYGKINLNTDKTSRYYYKVLDKNGKLYRTKKGHFVFKKIVNLKYDKNAKPIMLEMWEHKKCPKKLRRNYS